MVLSANIIDKVSQLSGRGAPSGTGHKPPVGCHAAHARSTPESGQSESTHHAAPTRSLFTDLNGSFGKSHELSLDSARSTPQLSRSPTQRFERCQQSQCTRERSTCPGSDGSPPQCSERSRIVDGNNGRSVCHAFAATCDRDEPIDGARAAGNTSRINLHDGRVSLTGPVDPDRTCLHSSRNYFAKKHPQYSRPFESEENHYCFLRAADSLPRLLWNRYVADE